MRGKIKSGTRTGSRFCLELLSRLELPNLILTKDALYRLSYNSILHEISYYILKKKSISKIIINFLFYALDGVIDCFNAAIKLGGDFPVFFSF